MEIREDEFVAANRRGRTAQAGPRALSASYDAENRSVLITLNNGLQLTVPAALVQGLEAATPAELERIEISPSGLGLHFPDIDADLYIPALIEGWFGSKSWMAKIGRQGGTTKSAAKAEAARRNGKLGGRPRRGAA
ncbi:MAG: DUF2442 domain-containing protein [Aromatoleum sp.]|jgi:hypothetical protein|uniref:DUF2442 domain-containing protein n=1 Tax=Aromatoleum sp. TaxID=2307007 RepID=UPI0028940C2D|nr:DUF2442 domain-containing protein [Aromatoleum sp.]MDT3669376.1 DUF2442 domain-containing protein [Aromatoleum sp.]